METTTVIHLMHPARHHRQRHPRPWTTWAWTAAAWLWVAQAIFRADVSGSPHHPTAQAGYAGSDALRPHAQDANETTLFFPAALPLPSVSAPDTTTQTRYLSIRHPEWTSLNVSLRHMINDSAATHSKQWKSILLTSTGERTGSAADFHFNHPKNPDDLETTAHFLIGNGSRSGDGLIERTHAPLEGDSLVIALIGDSRTHAPTAAQLRAVTELVDYLRAKTGILPVSVRGELRAALAQDAVIQAFGTSPATAHPTTTP